MAVTEGEDLLAGVDEVKGVTIKRTTSGSAIKMVFGPLDAYSITLKVGGSAVAVHSLELPGVEPDFRREVGVVVVPMLRAGHLAEALEYLHREFPADEHAAPGMDVVTSSDDDRRGTATEIFEPREFVSKIGETVVRSTISITSFGMRNGGPPSDLPKGWTKVSAMMFNGRGRNLTSLRGTDEELQQRIVRQTNDFDNKFRAVLALVNRVLQDSQQPISFGVFCSKGHHRSVAVSELVAKVLREAGFIVTVRHPHLNKR